MRILQNHPPQLLSALYHAGGLTSTKNVRFHQMDEHTTEVQVQTECLGEALDPAIAEADRVLRQVYELTLADYAEECARRMAQMPPSSVRTPENLKDRSA